MTEPSTAGPAPVVCCDLDGVIWRGDDAIPPAADGIARIRAAGLRVAFISNNSSVRLADVVAKLERMGVPAATDEVLTSALAAGWLLGRSLSPGARVLVSAGPGVVEALQGVGLTPVDRAPAEAVVVGFHQDFDFADLARASAAVRDGARFVATNLDPTYPVAGGGLIPGAGAIVAAIATAAGRNPEVAGKPAAPMAALVHERVGTTGIMVGDRPSTDGAMADALGWPFGLVLSGVTAEVPPPGGEPIPSPPPPFVGADLGELAPRLVEALSAPGAPATKPSAV